MSNFDAKEEFLHLKKVLHSHILILEIDEEALTLLKTRRILETSGQCCIVLATCTTSNKLRNINNLYRGAAVLKRLQRQLCSEYPSLQTSLIGIYPSLEYPACVYELNTNADRYVEGNVLPYASSPLISTIKYLISKLLGANPAVGGLGLSLYKE